MVIVIVEVLAVESKPPADVSVRISKCERHDFGTAAPISIKTSSLRGRAGGSAFMPKQVELFGPTWTLFCRTNIPMLHLNRSSGVLRALANLLV